MEPALIFYGAWTIEVTELVLGAGGPEVRLILQGTAGADGTYLNPSVGTRLEADGPQWIVAVEVSFDLSPFRRLEPQREFEFDPQNGMIAIVRAGSENPAFRAGITLRCTAQDPDLRGHPTALYDFTIPERRHSHPPMRLE